MGDTLGCVVAGIDLSGQQRRKDEHRYRDTWGQAVQAFATLVVQQVCGPELDREAGLLHTDEGGILFQTDKPEGRAYIHRGIWKVGLFNLCKSSLCWGAVFRLPAPSGRMEDAFSTHPVSITHGAEDKASSFASESEALESSACPCPCQQMHPSAPHTLGLPLGWGPFLRQVDGWAQGQG